MSSHNKDAWRNLKLAVDKFSQSTGAEVAVATVGLFESSNDNYQRKDPTVYGHGSLYHQVKKGLELVGKEDAGLTFGSQGMQKSLYDVNEANVDNSNMTGKPILASKGNHIALDPVSRSLSTSFRTLKLDSHPPPINPGLSGSTINSSTAGSSPDHGGQGIIPQRSGKRKGKNKKSKKHSQSEELEFGENLLFDESNHSSEEGDDSTEDSNDSEDDFQPSNRVYNVPLPQSRDTMNAAFATSLPVNINLEWGQGPMFDNASRFRDNRGPHPPMYNPKSRQVPSKPTIIRADKTPQPDTMMASMQALARSVTDDTALIFGERPRPRTQEGFKKNF
uniref:Uncharacterized protein LOC100176540 n=1 Tax=Phallusia mammillata TaxID=59560 RepID=A0A6F9DH88_9ASCI|nr:uncharacterized protein LOC100176540 [Phallusia mammillata]